MVNKIVSIPGYVHLYRSLLRFYHSSENEIKEMLYVLNTANLDCLDIITRRYALCKAARRCFQLGSTI